MAALFRVDFVRLVTDAGEYEFDLSAPCTILDGPVGTGKSSLLELIKYGLGGTAVLTPVVREEVNRVDLRVSVAGGSYELRRDVGLRNSRNVAVHDVGDDQAIELLPVKLQASDVASIGARLLQFMQFPQVRVPRARSRAAAASVALTFNDLYAYMYVAQQSIDASIVHHTEVFREPKRRALFELMFGLLNERQLLLETELGRVRALLAESEKRFAAAETFLGSSKIRTELELTERRLEMTRVATEAERKLLDLSKDIATVTSEHASLRDELRKIEKVVADADAKAEAAMQELSRRREVVAQLNLDAAREERMAVATQQLAALEFVTCPRCLQALDDGRASIDSCFLCLQPVSETQFTPGQLGDIDSQVSELEEALAGYEQSARLAQDEAMRLRLRRDSIRAALDDATSAAVTPRFQEISSLSFARAAAISEIEHATEGLSLWDELHSLQRSVDEQAAMLDELQLEIERERNSMPDREEVLGELSELLDETVTRMNLPWATSAEIDEANYLPLIDGEKFDTVAVAGGMKTMVTVSYHLSLLAYALQHPDCLLPSFLVLDTPRKNLGFNPDDSALGEQFYARVRALVDSYGSSVQFIIADNDVPLGDDWYRRIHFDYDRPLIQHVAHPGEEAVRAGDVPTVEGIANREW